MILALALLLAQGVDVDREQETVLTLSGRVDLDGMRRDRGLVNARGSAFGNDPETEIDGRALLKLDADIGASVRAVLSLETKRIESGVNVGLMGSNPEGQGLLLRDAYLELAGVPDPRVTLRAGTQSWAWRIRERCTGSLFFDPARSGSIAADAGPAVGGGTGASAALRDELQPTGLALTYIDEFITGDALFLPAIVEGGSANDDEAAYGTGIMVRWNRCRVGGIAMISATGFGSGSFSTLYTLGVGASLRDFFAADSEVFVEIYRQFGNVGSIASDQVSANGYAVEIGARLDWPDEFEKPWVEAKITLLTGDSSQAPGDTDVNAFLSYESVADLVVLEDPFFGVDWSTNMVALKVFVGGLVSVGAGEDNLKLEAVFGMAKTHRDVDFGPAEESRLGREVDLRAELAMTKQVTLDAVAGILVSSEVLEAMGGASGDSKLSVVAIGMRVRF